MMHLRVIGGKFRGMKLEMLDSPLTRPTKAILKESLFNVLQEEIRETLFIEAFGGSGSVGIEALSRGASEAIFFEQNPKSTKILQNNIAKLKEVKTQVFLGDSLLLLPQFLQKIQGKAILYLDPPFAIRENMQNIYKDCFSLIQNIQNPHIFLVIFEHLSSFEMPRSLGNFCIIKQKKFGKSSLSYYLKGH